MPQLGETVTEGTITRWAKSVGDHVAADEVLFEVSTDKVDTEVPSAHTGYLRAIHVAEGETVPIGTLLAVITERADEPLEEVPATSAEASPPAQTSPPAAAASPAPTSPPAQTPAAAASPPAPSGNGRSDFLSPAVRRLLHEQDLSAGDVVGSGRDGRITRADVLAAAANRARPATARASDGAAPAPAPGVPRGAILASGVEPGADDEVVEFSRARRMTAEHMVRSLATSAHTLVVTEVDYHRVDPVRRASRLSFLPFVARAVVDALREFPHLNASVGDDCLIVHRKVNLGVAVDVGFEALVVPVVKDAAAKRLRALAEEFTALAERARAKRLTGDDLSGGTFSLTNVGQYGTVTTAPVINQPQIAILSTDGIRMRPVALATEQGEWTIAVHPVGNLSLTFDHRAVDGAYAAAFLAKVRDVLETRDWSQEVA
jgi:pyruvate dehydrogenase E2 component (dihydrolipoamide acetyltransferase)